MIDDQTLMKLYEAVKAGRRPTVRELSPDVGRIYNVQAKRRSRAADRISGVPP
jgi:hypothetical protein